MVHDGPLLVTYFTLEFDEEHALVDGQSPSPHPKLDGQHSFVDVQSYTTHLEHDGCEIMMRCPFACCFLGAHVAMWGLSMRVCLGLNVVYLPRNTCTTRTVHPLSRILEMTKGIALTVVPDHTMCNQMDPGYPGLACHLPFCKGLPCGQ